MELGDSPKLKSFELVVFGLQELRTMSTHAFCSDKWFSGRQAAEEMAPEEAATGRSHRCLAFRVHEA